MLTPYPGPWQLIHNGKIVHSKIKFSSSRGKGMVGPAERDSEGLGAASIDMIEDQVK
jgi:hypothetical protein